MTDRTIHNNRQDKVVLNKTIKEAYSVDVAVPNSHYLHSIATGKLQKYKDLKEKLTRRRQLPTPCIIPTVLPSTAGIIRNYLHGSLKLLSSAVLYIYSITEISNT